MVTTAPVPESRPRILPPAGTHKARIVRLVLLGTQKGEYMGKETLRFKVWLDFELVEKTHVFKEGEPAKPFVVGQEFTLSMYTEAPLRKLIEGILGVTLLEHEAEGFDIESLLNQACLVNVKKKQKKDGTDKVIIDSASPLMEDMIAKEATNPITKLTFDEWNEDTFSMLPKFMQDKITSSPEYDKMKNPKPKKDPKYMEPVEYPTEDVGDIPF